MTRRPIRPDIRIGPDDDETADPLQAKLRDAFALWASGVTILTVVDAQGATGMTATAFTPVSLEPPLLLVCVHRDAPILPRLLEAGRFTVNVLAEGQRGLASAFADRFPVHLRAIDSEGAIGDALASITCSVEAAYPGGDHQIVVGKVKGVRTEGGRGALLYYDRGYRGTGQG